MSDQPETQLAGLYLTRLPREHVLMLLEVARELLPVCQPLAKDLLTACDAEATRRAADRQGEGVEPTPITIREGHAATSLQLCEAVEVLAAKTMQAVATAATQPEFGPLRDLLRQLTGYTLGALRFTLGGQA